MSTQSVSIHKSDDDLHGRKMLITEIKQRREDIKSYLSKEEPRGAKLTTVNIICSAIATFLTAAPAVGGKTLLDAIGGTTAVVRILLAIAALLSLVSAIVANLYRSQEIATHLGKAHASDAILKWLEVALNLKQVPLEEAATQYRECLQETDFVPETGQAKSQSALDKVKGEIRTPRANEVVEDVISCSGWAKGEGLGSNLHLWLAVRIKDRMWIKEGEVLPDADHSWTKRIHETGAPEAFSLALYVADDEANDKVKAWFEQCDRVKGYRALEWKISGLQWLDQVDNLRHSNAPRATSEAVYAKAADLRG
jgi:hypothetical protein